MKPEEINAIGGSLWPLAFPPHREEEMTPSEMAKFRWELFNHFNTATDKSQEQVGIIVREASRMTRAEARTIVDREKWDGVRLLKLFSDAELLAAMGRLQYGSK